MLGKLFALALVAITANGALLKANRAEGITKCYNKVNGELVEVPCPEVIIIVGDD